MDYYELLGVPQCVEKELKVPPKKKAMQPSDKGGDPDKFKQTKRSIPNTK